MDSKDEKKYLDSIKNKIYIELPFTRQELTEEIFTQAISGGFSDLNKHFPNIVDRYSYSGDNSDQVVLRSYLSQFDDAQIEPYAKELGYGVAEIHKVAISWDYDSITSFPLADKYFKDIVKYRAGMYMANVRRSATMNDLPFDIKGDQFFEEMKESYNSTLDKLANEVLSTI